MQPFAASTLAERGVDADGFVATAVGEGMLASADLVLTATREHRSAVVGIVPSAVRRSFTLMELARVAVAAAPRPGLDDPAGAHPADAEQVRQSIAWAAQMRGTLPRPAEGADDLEDPLGAPQSVYRARADAITAAVEQIAPFLIGTRPAATAG
jgi:protein-tyrosine phosphatase